MPAHSNIPSLTSAASLAGDWAHRQSEAQGWNTVIKEQNPWQQHIKVDNFSRTTFFFYSTFPTTNLQLAGIFLKSENKVGVRGSESFVAISL